MTISEQDEREAREHRPLGGGRPMTDLAETIARWKSSIPNFDLLGEVSGSFVVSYKEALALLDAAEAGMWARDAALEEAARVAEALGQSNPSMPLYDLACQTIANRIRFLKGAA